MCKNQEAYACMQRNADICIEKKKDGDQHQTSNSMGGLDLGNIAKSSLDMAPSLSCLCNKCAKSKNAYIKFQTTLSLMMMKALAAFASMMKPDVTTASPSQLKKEETDLMQSVCPTVGAAECFAANPTVCHTAKLALGSTNKIFSDATTTKKLKAMCTKAGANMDPEKVVLGAAQNGGAGVVSSAHVQMGGAVAALVVAALFLS